LWAFFAFAAPCSPTYQEGYDEMVYKYAHGAKIGRLPLLTGSPPYQTGISKAAKLFSCLVRYGRNLLGIMLATSF
jgi:hypothetical protein